MGLAATRCKILDLKRRCGTVSPQDSCRDQPAALQNHTILQELVELPGLSP